MLLDTRDRAALWVTRACRSLSCPDSRWFVSRRGHCLLRSPDTITTAPRGRSEPSHREREPGRVQEPGVRAVTGLRGSSRRRGRGCAWLPREHTAGSGLPGPRPSYLLTAGCKLYGKVQNLIFSQPAQAQVLRATHLCSETHKRILQISDAQGGLWNQKFDWEVKVNFAT